jgi:hypothetical protein
MPQYNLFGEVETDVMQAPAPEMEPEPVFIPPARKNKKRKNFDIGICRACDQLLLDDPDNTRIKYDEELCPACDERLRARYDKFRNLALARALRVHKYI